MLKPVHPFSKKICALIIVLNTLFMGHITAHSPKQSSSIHEADHEDLKVLAHIKDLQTEIYSQINASGSRSRIKELKELACELEDIAQDYTQLAPGTAFLGPISSVSLVLKQRELQKRIVQIEKLIYQR